MAYALVIDDDPSQASGIESAIGPSGLSVATAATWDEGYAAFLAMSPDLVIADYNLPGSRHGLRLLLEIARLRPTVRLVLISGYLLEEDVKAILALGLVDRVLRKSDPIATAAAVVEEIRDAHIHSQDDVDWQRFATALQHRGGVSEDDLDALDSFLKANRLT